MKLEYSRTSRQFFFVTVSVAGRRAILSHIVDESPRPALLFTGEIVAAGLRAMHLVNPAVTLSNYVIMPDHVHFIMIVDYSRDKMASPLYLTHRVMDAVEMYVERTGALPPHPQPPTPAGMAQLIAGAVARRGAGARPPSVPIFERSPYIELSFDSRQLKSTRSYIKLNPARAIWKQLHPDMFLCHRAIKSKLLCAT